MANVTTIRLDADISGLKKGIQEANRQIRLANAEFRAASTGMDDWSKSAQGIQSKLTQLRTVLGNQRAILQSYERQLQLVVEEQGENSRGADELRIAIANQQAAINRTTSEIGRYTTALDTLESEQRSASNSAEGTQSAYDSLQREISEQEDVLDSLKQQYANVILEQGRNSDEARGLATQIDSLSSELSENRDRLSEAEDAADELDNTLGDVDDSANDAANGGFTVMKGALANLVSAGIEKALEGLKALGDKIIEVGKLSISNYASYEQLAGGVETLFGDSADIVENYANNAFKSAGLSANDYMETVTGFSASLLQGLNGDTAKAAKVADMAISDMSDNANKMGSDMSSIQNAYQGFAKQNYTMLDNLKLGYSGTQAEMARLINDSGVLGDTMTVTAENVNEVSYDKIIEAIHKVQDEMGITGTTSKEAADTIEGSKNSMMASWNNLLTGLADDDADIEALFDTFIETAKTYASNLLPRVGELIDNVVTFAGEKLREKFPETMEAVDEVVSTVKDGFEWIKEHAVEISAAIVGIGTAFLAFKAVTFIQSAITAFQLLATVIQAVGVKQAALNLIMSMNPIGLIIAAIAGLVAAFVVLWNNSEQFRNFWIGLWEKITDAVSVAIDWITGIFDTVVNFFKDNWQSILLFLINPFAGLFKYAYDNFEWFRDFIDGIVQGVVDFFVGMGEKISQIFSDIWNSIVEFFTPAIEWFSELFSSISESLQSAIEVAVGLVTGSWELIKAIWGVVSTWFNDHVITPVKKFFTKLWTSVSNAAKNTWDSIKSVWKKVSGWFSDHIITPVKEFFTGMWENLKTGASDAWEGIKSVFSTITKWFEEKFSAAWEAVKNVFSTGGKIFDGIKEGIVDTFKTVVNGIIKGINKIIKIPFNAINKMLNKIRNISVGGVEPFSGLWDENPLTVPQIPELASGGVLKRGQVGLLEGNGAEAVVPLENNKKWIAKTAKDLKTSLQDEGVLGPGNGGNVVNNNYNFNQTNNSPKPLNRLEIYRQTKNQLNFAKGV